MIEAPQLQTTKKYGFTFQRIIKLKERYSVLYARRQNLFDSKTSYEEWNIDENWTVLMPN
jgi:hypothetical protein